jgi:hypothetical protein
MSSTADASHNDSINNATDRSILGANTDTSRETIHFVTGKLAEASLREIVASLASKQAFDFTIEVLPITVAALMTPKWLLKHMRITSNPARVS